MLKYVLVLIGLAFIVTAGCTDIEKTRGELQTRNDAVIVSANRAVPVPETSNYLSREQVAKWLVRQDTPDRPYYVYIIADTGNFLGYYVAQSRPVNTCSFLTPPERWARRTDVVLPNPGLDGIYYGDGGSCNQWFFFDAATDAMIEISGLKFFTSDQPLRLEADPIMIEPVE